MANMLAIAGPNSPYKLAGAPRAGFWHGLLMPLTFLISVFNARVGIYETSNRGGLYDLGFVLGASAAFGGGAELMRQSGSPPLVA
jgi:hypothetical protein